MTRLEMGKYHAILTKKQQKYQQLPSGKTDNHEFLTGEEILPSVQSRIMEQAKFTYSPLGKGFEKNPKTIKEQGRKKPEAIEEHGKHLNLVVKKKSLTLLNQKEIFRELANERINEIHFFGFKGPLNFYKGIKDGYATLEKAVENEKEIQIRYKWNSKKEE